LASQLPTLDIRHECSGDRREEEVSGGRGGALEEFFKVIHDYCLRRVIYNKNFRDI